MELFMGGFVVIRVTPEARNDAQELLIQDWGVAERWFHVSDHMKTPYEVWFQECEVVTDPEQLTWAGAAHDETPLKATHSLAITSRVLYLRTVRVLNQ